MANPSVGLMSIHCGHLWLIDPFDKLVPLNANTVKCIALYSIASGTSVITPVTCFVCAIFNSCYNLTFSVAKSVKV